MNIVEKTTQAGGKLVTTISFPRALWKRTKQLAIDHDMPAQEIVVSALEAYLPKLERRKPS